MIKSNPAMKHDHTQFFHLENQKIVFPMLLQVFNVSLRPYAYSIESGYKSQS